MFKRTRYQHGSLEREERKKGPAVWVYRWWEEDIDGKLVHRKLRIGDVETYPSESAAHAAADALRLTVNNRCNHRSLQRTTINTVWEHYRREELPVKADFVLARGSLGILQPQPDLVGHTGCGGKRGTSTGDRVSAKRQKSPLKLTADQVAQVLTDALHSVRQCRSAPNDHP